MEDKKDYNYLFKILLLGDSFVGKTNMLKRFLTDKFDSNTKETVGVEFGSKDFVFGEKKDIVKAQIWDTAGQERYRSITKSYYQGAKGVLLVYDITQRASFENIDNWIVDLSKNGDKDIYILLIGNKADLESSRVVTKEEGQAKAGQYNIAFFETSAKSGDNIGEAFKELVEKVYLANINIRQSKTKIVENNGDGINLVCKDTLTKKKKKCC
jgi:Ras-related protein Rab-11A